LTGTWPCPIIGSQMHTVHLTANARSTTARRLSGNPVDGKERATIEYRGTLTAERAQAIISTNFTRFRGRHAVLLDEGWDFQVFEDGLAPAVHRMIGFDTAVGRC